MLLLTASCSNDENNEQKEPAQTVQFSFTNEDFGEDETPSRATSAAETKPQTIDLGDCEAEITVENEPAVKKTRGAQTPANGHYTIRAYQGGTLKGEIKGTFNGGKFSPDASSKRGIILPHGTYDFIAFNDDVIPLGNDLTVARDKAATAMIGFANGQNISQEPRQLVSFTMKHVGARLRTQFVCKKDIPNAITATLEATAANVIPTSVAYNPATRAYIATNGAMTAEPNNSPASTEVKYIASFHGLRYSYTSTCTDYHYFLPTTEGNKLKLSFSAGTLFWKPLTGTIPQFNAPLQMQSGRSYLVKIKLKPQYIYLMSNGDIGTFRETTFGGAPAATAKTPIAVIVNQGNHMAIALNEANGGADMYWCTNTYYNTQATTYMASLTDALNSQATNGVEDTWDASRSTSAVTGNKVKALNPDFLAFYAAAHYNPGVAYTGSPTLQWYLPSYNDFKWLFSLGFGDNAAVTEEGQYKWYGGLANDAFTQVGGTTISMQNYWSTLEYDNTKVGFVTPYNHSVSWDGYGKNNSNCVRSFVKY